MANAIYTIYLAIRIADADNCAQNLGNFGGQTNIKSILLTFPLIWGGRSDLDLPPQWCLDVNGIDLTFVPTPKVAKFCGHFGVRRADAAKQ
jgi:hypothetical protein